MACWNLAKKKALIRQAIADGNHTSRHIAAWLEAHGYYGQSGHKIGQFIRQRMTYELDIDKGNTKNKEPYRYSL